MASLPPLPLGDASLRERHLLALPAEVEPDEVEVLAASRFASARWEDDPAADRPSRRPITAAFGIRAVGAQPAPARVLRLGRLSHLVGPYAVTPQDAVALGLPTGTATAFSVVAPTERGEAPYPGGDRDGLKRAFPRGLPVREEERVVLWLVAAARRFGGAVRIGGSGAVLTPEVDAAIDLTVLTDRWVEPAQALLVVRTVAPRARPSEATAVWNGPMPGSGRHAAAGLPAGISEPGGTGLSATLRERGVQDERERRHLMDEASAFDELMLAAPPLPEGFGVLVDLGVDGVVAVEVSAAETLPPLIAPLPWAQKGVVAYRIHWEPPDVEELERERPSHPHRVARSRAVPMVQAIARALLAHVGGEVVDEADFLVDPADL